MLTVRRVKPEKLSRLNEALLRDLDFWRKVATDPTFLDKPTEAPTLKKPIRFLPKL